MERHCPLQIEIGGCRHSTDPVSGQSRAPTKTTSPLLPFLPPSLPPSRLMLLYLQPSPRIREVETTSRHFVCADRPSETGDNREKERLQRPTTAAPRTAGGRKSGGEIPSALPRHRSITKPKRRQWRGNRIGDIYINVCTRRKYSEKSKEGGVLRSADGEERRKRAIN